MTKSRQQIESETNRAYAKLTVQAWRERIERAATKQERLKAEHETFHAAYEVMPEGQHKEMLKSLMMARQEELQETEEELRALKERYEGAKKFVRCLREVKYGDVLYLREDYGRGIESRRMGGMKGILQRRRKESKRNDA